MTSQAKVAGQPVLVMAGGTGGHVFPALAVAEELRLQGVPVVWMGTDKGLEARIVPPAGFPMERIRVSGLRGKGKLRLLSAPFMLLPALWQAARILLRVKPRAVLGMGGFATGPGGVMAWLLRKPLLIHEQNSIAGLTNRLLAAYASCNMEAFPGSLKAKWHPILTGNPVRNSIARIREPNKRLASRTGESNTKLRLLVLGGSLGAQVLNEVVPLTLAHLPNDLCPDVRHQTGTSNLDIARAAYKKAGITASLEPFISDMAEAYSWADLVLCRAGALTISELTCAGVASVLVPYPHAVDDHQTANAHWLVNGGAAVLLPQQKLTVASLAQILVDFSQHPERLLEMAIAARSLAQPDAAHQVAVLCLTVAKNHNSHSGRAAA